MRKDKIVNLSKFSKDGTSESYVNLNVLPPTIWQENVLINAIKMEYSKYFYKGNFFCFNFLFQIYVLNLIINY
jgi:hypothetical protein